MIDMRNTKAKLEIALTLEPKTKADQNRRAELMYEVNTMAQVLQAQSLWRIAEALAPARKGSTAGQPLTREQRVHFLGAERALDEAIERGDLEPAAA